jgi:hypothetical protein
VTGIIGWRRATASDLRTVTESTRPWCHFTLGRAICDEGRQMFAGGDSQRFGETPCVVEQKQGESTERLPWRRNH